MIDSTNATPVNCRPPAIGIDLVKHSATKNLAVHNDVLAGVVCGSAGLTSMIRDLRGVLGTVCDPHAAFLVGRRASRRWAYASRGKTRRRSPSLKRLEKHPRIEAGLLSGPRVARQSHAMRPLSPRCADSAAS